MGPPAALKKTSRKASTSEEKTVNPPENVGMANIQYLAQVNAPSLALLELCASSSDKSLAAGDKRPPSPPSPQHSLGWIQLRDARLILVPSHCFAQPQLSNCCGEAIRRDSKGKHFEYSS